MGTTTYTGPASEYADTMSSCCGETYHRPAGEPGPWFCYACGRTNTMNGDRIGAQGSLFTAGGRDEQLGFAF